MGVYWVLIDISTKQMLMEKELFSKEQSYNTAREAKATVLLDTVKTIQSKSYQITTSQIKIAADNKKVQEMSHSILITSN